MVTPAELLRVVLAPVLVALVLAALGRWRKWAWTMPLAAGAGFVVGYALVLLPALPPINGNDWLFWLAVPVTALGIIDAIFGGRWGWALAIVGAAGVVWVIGRPLLAGESLTPGRLAVLVAVVGAGAGAVCLAMRLAEPRVGSWAVVAALCITLGGAAVVIMSSGGRTLGLVGVAASAALGPIAVLIHRLPTRGVVTVATSLLTGLFAGSWLYAYPGISKLNFILLGAAPLLLFGVAYLPVGKRTWLRGVVGVVVVAILVAALTVPAASRAKKEAESTTDELYDAYYR